MALFVLREGFRVETTATGGRVVHNRTGDALQLSPLEVQVLARATAWGINPKDPELRPVIRKLSGLGLLKPASGEPAVDVDIDFDEPAASAGSETSAPAGFSHEPSEPVAAPVTAPAPTPLPEPAATAAVASGAPPMAAAGTRPSPNDIVPLFRGELKVTRKGHTSLYDVADPASGRTFTLYDFELSLARMLTGKRPYSEVITIGERLGIPVNLESLDQFIRQLERYGFLAPAGTQQPEPQEGSVWAPREKWDEQLRTLFQSGLKMSRQGRYGEAASYFEAMLQQDPDNPEALEMLTQVQQRLSSDPSLAVVTPAFPDSAVEGVGDLLSSDASLSLPPPPTPSTEPAAAPASAARASRRKMPVPLAAAAACIALAGVASGAWLALRESPPNPPLELPPVAAEPSPPKPAPVAPVAPAPSGATAVPPTAAAAAPVAPAAPEAASPPAVPAQAPATAAAEPAPAAAPTLPSPAEKSPVAEQAQPPPAPAAPAENAVTASLAKRGRVTMDEVTAPANGTVSWKVAAHQPVRRGEVVATLRIGKRERPLVAAKPGLLLPKVAEGGAAEEDDIVAEVVHTEAFLQARVEGARPQQTWGCDVVDAASGNSASCKIITVATRGSGFFVTATTEPLWFDTATQPRLRLTPR